MEYRPAISFLGLYQFVVNVREQKIMVTLIRVVRVVEMERVIGLSGICRTGWLGWVRR